MLFFHHIVLLLSLSKADVLFCIIIILKTISLTCFNNFSKAEAKKNNEEIHNRDTKYYIENICHQFPDLYMCHQIPDVFKAQKQPPVVFFK